MKDSVHSPYRDAVKIIYDDGSSSLERVEPLYIITGDEPIHTVVDGETLQSIAYQMYGDSGLWYKIADVNNIVDPFNDVVAEMQLVIPKS